MPVVYSGAAAVHCCGVFQQYCLGLGQLTLGLVDSSALPETLLNLRTGVRMLLRWSRTFTTSEQRKKGCGSRITRVFTTSLSLLPNDVIFFFVSLYIAAMYAESSMRREERFRRRNRPEQLILAPIWKVGRVNLRTDVSWLNGRSSLLCDVYECVHLIVSLFPQLATASWKIGIFDT